jgi:hypothetical protein
MEMPPAGATPGLDPTHSAGLDDPRAPQFLATEHWSLLATRSMSWNEAFSRTGMFLSTLSAATVALALAGPAMAFGPAFTLFALVILSVTLFLGVATFVRLSQVNNEDLYWVYGMNLLRGAYVQLVPGIEHAFVAGHTVDPAGIARTFAAVDVTSRMPVLHLLVTTPAVVGVISSAIAGVMAGLVAVQLAFGMEISIVVGVLTFLVAVSLFIAYARREGSRYIARMLRLEADRVAAEARNR